MTLALRNIQSHDLEKIRLALLNLALRITRVPALGEIMPRSNDLSSDFSILVLMDIGLVLCTLAVGISTEKSLVLRVNQT